ncbi:MAG: hypothetical protein L6N96_01575 [Candidatus Methylarchaceae archaeon HK02M2]|nr:hypothetical protein [Candidatus Methylarchaceae archaeon HK02M2]
MVDIKEIVKNRFEESKKKVITKHNDIMKEIEKELRSYEEKALGKFR